MHKNVGIFLYIAKPFSPLVLHSSHQRKSWDFQPKSHQNQVRKCICCSITSQSYVPHGHRNNFVTGKSSKISDSSLPFLIMNIYEYSKTRKHCFTGTKQQKILGSVNCLIRTLRNGIFKYNIVSLFQLW